MKLRTSIRIGLGILGFAMIPQAFAAESLRITVPSEGKVFEEGDQVVAYQTYNREIAAYSEHGGTVIPTRHDLGVGEVEDVMNGNYVLVSLPKHAQLKPSKKVHLERVR